MQSPQMMLTSLVARTDCPHLGQTSFLVLDGLLPPAPMPAPFVCAVPVLPILIAGGRVLRPRSISFHPLFNAYSTRLSPGLVFQPYCPLGTQVSLFDAVLPAVGVAHFMDHGVQCFLYREVKDFCGNVQLIGSCILPLPYF